MKKRIALICTVVVLLLVAIAPSIASAMSVGFSAGSATAPKTQTASAPTKTTSNLPTDFAPTTSTTTAGTMTTAKSMSAASSNDESDEPDAVTDDANAVDTGATAITVSKYSEYLVSEREISFTEGDAVCRKAAQLTAGKTTTEAKVVAIFNYIVKNFRYNYDLYNQVKSGQVTSYTPNPVSILASNKGICYDIASLFAAMCRSQGIPCKMVKGYAKPVGGGYHAWNSIYDQDTNEWVSMDGTVRMGKSTSSRYVEIKASEYTVRSET